MKEDRESWDTTWCGTGGGGGVNRGSVVRHLNTPNCLFGGFPISFPSPKVGKRAARSQFGIIEMGGAP